MSTESRDTRQIMMEAAVRLFSERGYQAVSTREICEASGFTKPTLYYHFQSKEGMVRAILDEILDRYDHGLSEIAAQDLPAVEKLRVFLVRDFEAVRKNARLVSFLVQFLAGPDSAGIRDEYEERFWSIKSVLVDIVREGQKAGSIRPELDAEIIGGIISATTDRLTASYARTRKPDLTEELADQLLNTLRRGLDA